MRRKLLSVILAAVLCFGVSINLYEPICAADPHYYATALQDFINNATGKTTAVLFDLDGDGNDEMIAFDEGIKPGKYEHWGEMAEGDKITVYAIKNGNNISSTIEPAYTFTTYQVYITNKDYLAIIDTFEGSSYEIYKYEDVILSKKAVLVDGCYANDIYYSVNGIECDESQFIDKLNEYGVDNVAVAIGYGQMVATAWLELHGDDIPKDDTAKILAMTAKPIAVPTASTVFTSDISIFIDGKKLDTPVPPIIENDRTLVPMRIIFESLGMTVEWDEATRKVTGKNDNTTIVLTIDSKVAIVNDIEKELDVAPKIINDSTFVPLRFVAEAIDCNVSWDDNTREIKIMSINTTKENSPIAIPIAPNQSYVGIWYSDEFRLDDLKISEIDSDTINFQMGIFRLATIYATAKIENNKIKFSGNISSDYSGSTISGMLEFYEDSISVTISESEFEYIEAGTIFNFTVRDEK